MANKPKFSLIDDPMLEKVEEVEPSVVTPVVTEVSKPLRWAKLQAVHRRISNPVTGATYFVDRTTDVNDLDAPDCHFERSQLKANILRIVLGG